MLDADWTREREKERTRQLSAWFLRAPDRRAVERVDAHILVMGVVRDMVGERRREWKRTGRWRGGGGGRKGKEGRLPLPLVSLSLLRLPPIAGHRRRLSPPPLNPPQILRVTGVHCSRDLITG